MLVSLSLSPPGGGGVGGGGGGSGMFCLSCYAEMLSTEISFSLVILFVAYSPISSRFGLTSLIDVQLH